MRRGAISVFVVVLCVFFSASAAKPRSLARSRVVLSTRERSLVAAENATRALHALPKLGINWRLTLAARSHSQEMLRWGECAHGNFSARMSRFHVRGHVF